MSNKTAKEIMDFLRASFPGIWLLSQDPADAVMLVKEICIAQEWPLVEWDAANGPREIPLGPAAEEQKTAPHLENQPVAAGAPGPQTPRNALAYAKRIADKLNLSEDEDDNGDRVVVIMHYPQRFWERPDVVQHIHHVLQGAKSGHPPVVIVAIAGSVKLPEELDKDFVIVEHALPDRKELQAIAEGIGKEAELAKGKIGKALDAAMGLSRSEAESAFAISAAKHKKLLSRAVWEFKAQAVKKSSSLSLWKGKERLEDLGGMEGLKQFAVKLLYAKPKLAHHLLRVHGLLLLGPSGTGKSAFAKALGHATHRPTLSLNMGSIFAGLVGASEENLRRNLRVADAMAPCILFVDEIEKALSGAGSGGKGDSGVSERIFGELLTWLNDHQTSVFFIGTCNDISKLPPEFSRAERFDSIFFIDLPTPAQQQMIWDIYMKMFQIEPQKLPLAEDWTGAEILSCCRLASLLNEPLVEIGKGIVPVANTAAESIQRLRSWAHGRVRCAETSSVYRHSPEQEEADTHTVKRTRRIMT